MVSFEDALKIVGEFGRYQIFIYFFCFTMLRLTAVFSNLPIVFQVATPDHWCKTPSLTHLNITKEIQVNLSIPTFVSDGKLEYSRCLQYDRDYFNWTQRDVSETLKRNPDNVSSVKCKSGWEYDDTIYHSTIVTEWDLVCDKKVWVATSKSMFLAGFIVGVLLFGFLSDRFGRKKTYFVTVVLRAIFSMLVPFSPNLISFLAYRFIIGAVAIGNYTSLYILMLELVGPSWRGFVAVVMNYLDIPIASLATGIAYLIRDWRHLALALSIPAILQLLNLFFIQESPRWLYTQGRKEEASTILKRIAKINRTKFPEELEIEIKKEEKGKFVDLVRSPRLRLRITILCAQWFAINLVYYGLAYGTGDLGGNPYLSFFLGLAVEVPSNILCHIFLRFGGRKTLLIASNITAGVALLGILAVPNSYTGGYYIILSLSLIGRLASCAAFITVYLYTAELLPTVVRSVGMGTASATSRFGGISAQYLMGLKDVSLIIPYASMGGISIFAAILLWPLPETKDRKLAETIVEGENLGRKDPDERVVDTASEKDTEMESTNMQKLIQQN